MLTDSQLQALKDLHGDIRDILFEDDDGNELHVVLRRPRADRNDPKQDEFFSFWSRRAVIEQTPRQVEDPTQDGTSEMLRCLVHPDAMIVRKHLGNYPADAADLRDLFNELAGTSAAVDAPDLVTEQLKTDFHRRAFAMKVAGRPVVARPMSGAEYSTFLNKNGGGVYPMRAEALAWAAWSCVNEVPDAEKRKPVWDALVAEFPMVAIMLGIALLGAAKSRVKDRQKKSTTPLAPPVVNTGTESSGQAAACSTPLPAGPGAPEGEPELST